MPLTTLDPKTALVVVDVQKGILSLPLVHPAATIAYRASRLAKAFRASGQPVVLVNVNGVASLGRTDAGPTRFTLPPEWSELVPELEPQPSDIRITKQRPDAFFSTTLDSDLKRRGITQVVLCGVATSLGVESTARAAYDHGYNVSLVVDAMTDMDAEAHQHSIARVFPRLGETGTSDVLLALLEKHRAV
jgi:nicotinamidase-related amidase